MLENIDMKERDGERQRQTKRVREKEKEKKEGTGCSKKFSGVLERIRCMTRIYVAGRWETRLFSFRNFESR